MTASATWHAAVSVQRVVTKTTKDMTKKELNKMITMAYGNIGHIKDVTNITVKDVDDEIVCTVSGHTTKTTMLAKMTLTFDQKESCWRIS